MNAKTNMNEIKETNIKHELKEIKQT